MRAFLILAAGVVAIAACLVLLFGLPARPVSETVSFRQVGFADLKGWAEDDHGAALEAFVRSCAVLDSKADDSPVGPSSAARDWRGACALARAVAPDDAGAARRFFEASFRPVRLRAGRAEHGLFTGYYEPELVGSLTADDRFKVPLLARPADLVSVDLGLFRPDLAGRRIAGRLDGGRLLPYDDRRAIEATPPEVAGRRVLVFVDNAVDAFFLHIQGSGRVRLPDGGVLRVGYDGQNGHPYTAIGKLLIETGAIAREAMSMQAIRAWLANNPEAAADLMAANASYVFFRALAVTDPALGPPGAMGVALTPGRSLAVDHVLHGFGVPVWLETAPTEEAGLERVPALSRLMVAQDTGGAIRGAVRGDVFWGFGDEAARLAGFMRSRGRMTLLLPEAAVARLFETR